MIYRSPWPDIEPPQFSVCDTLGAAKQFGCLTENESVIWLVPFAECKQRQVARSHWFSA